MSTEPSNKKDIWKPCFYKSFPGFASILPLWIANQEKFVENFPTCDDFNTFAAESGNVIHFISQLVNMRYEWEIYRNRAVPMRANSWHDFFNNLTWLTFPKLKWAIVEKICDEPSTATTRTSLQNTLAHFDECGIVICSDKPEIFEMIKNFAWKQLFRHTQNLEQHCKPVIIGHGLFEKALAPYIGMTAKAVFLPVKKSFFTLNTQDQNHFIDQEIAKYIASADFPHAPKALQPFPMLGWAGWHPDNHEERFYDNADYFRPRRVTSD